MKRLRFGSLSLFTGVVLAACSTSPGDAPEGVGGGDASAGTGIANAGAPAGGGAAAGGTASVSGGAGNASVAGSAGATSTAGTSAGSGAGGGGSPSGGASTGGGGATSGGSGGMAGAGGSGPKTVKPSAGCSKGSTQLTIPNSLVTLPAGYTGTTPVPAVFAFHPANNDASSIKKKFDGGDLAKKYVMVYPNATNKSGWVAKDEQRYLDARAALLSDGCVDENRIYGTGHSSGAQFVVQLLCSGAADFNGVAPVASSVYCQKWKDGAVPALVIHGVKDQERIMYGLNDGDGKKDLQPYLTSNACQMTSMPFTPNVSTCNIQNGIDGKPFNPGCVEFDGCSVKTRWCNHNDPNYGTSNHDVPCFGVRAIFDFFESL